MDGQGISGWYYDYQMDPSKSPMTTVSLHSNMIYEEPANVSGVGGGDSSGASSANKATDNGYVWKKCDAAGVEVDTQHYSKTPLCTSILKDDFAVGVSNSWTDVGGDALGEMWNNVKQYAPYAGAVADALSNMANNQDPEALNDNGIAGFAARLVDHIGSRKDGGNSAVDKAVDYMNRVLVVQGTRFSYYSGTDINFGTLGMKFTILPTWKNGTFVSVNQQIDALYPYFVGEFVKETALGEWAKEYIGWQKPPNGYKPNVKNIDQEQEGTFKLKIGTYYSLYNLIVTDAQFNWSRQMVKVPKSMTGNEISPLYCDVSLNFRPATKFSDKALREFVSGRARQLEIREVQNYLNAKLLGNNYVMKELRPAEISGNNM